MNHWPFIEAAYIITGIGTAILLLLTVMSMRSAEKLNEVSGDDR